MASEDIGNADPRALTLALDAWNTYDRLGTPEGELAIAQAIIYLSCAAKSNAVYRAYNEAVADVKKQSSLGVPLHLRNAPTRLMTHTRPVRVISRTTWPNPVTIGRCPAAWNRKSLRGSPT